MDVMVDAVRYGWGAGPWWPIFPLLWIGLFGVLIVAALRFRGRSWHRDRSAEELLAERYARGEISVDEYRDRLRVLRESGS